MIFRVTDSLSITVLVSQLCISHIMGGVCICAYTCNSVPVTGVVDVCGCCRRQTWVGMFAATGCNSVFLQLRVCVGCTFLFRVHASGAVGYAASVLCSILWRCRAQRCGVSVCALPRITHVYSVCWVLVNGWCVCQWGVLVRATFRWIESVTLCAFII